MAAQKSRLRRMLIFIIEAAALVAVLAIIFVKVPALNKMAQRKPSSPTSTSGTQQVNQANPSASQGAGAPQANVSTQQQEGQFDVSVYDVQTDAASGALAVTLQINNPSKIALQFDPAKQFKLVGLATKKETAPISVAGKPSLAAQELKPSQTINGVIYVQKPANEQYELRFYPNIGDPAYTVVPLIAVPAGGQ